MNRLPLERRAAILGMLTEGNSLRSTSRMADVSINTVTKLLVDVGAACEEYQDKTIRGLRTKRIQCDEIWSFVYAKAKNLPKELKGTWGVGDVWTWTALDADTKLMVSWAVGPRDPQTAHGFMRDLATRIASRIQLTTDGHTSYVRAVEGAFGADVDFAQLVKLYGGGDATGRQQAEARYSPNPCIGARKVAISGHPAWRDISTSYVERSNLTMRMSMRRFTRLTNAFSKKLDNHKAAIALYFMHYNFARIHKTLRVTPAMEAGVADHVWELDEIARLAVGE